VPSGAYLGFRTETQYGDGGHALEPGDVVSYLAWCRQLARLEAGAQR
jgi:hypothetical protein